MDRYLFDTSAVSDFIQPESKRLRSVVIHLRRYLRARSRLTFSEMTYFEVLRGLLKKNARAQTQHFHELCDRSELLPVTFEVFDRAAHLWAVGQRRGATVDDGDLIIAATALVAKLPLVTANPKHFAWITGLAVSNWRDG
jgi:tRNA(fMet)-specific endonuclease VapC